MIKGPKMKSLEKILVNSKRRIQLISLKKKLIREYIRK